MGKTLNQMAAILSAWAREHYSDGLASSQDLNVGVDQSPEDVARLLLELAKSSPEIDAVENEGCGCPCCATEPRIAWPHMIDALLSARSRPSPSVEAAGL